ncbi:MAG: ATP-grasp domain-containing protein [Pseudomonadota bacterium]
MNVLFFSPGYPDEMGRFACGLARCGVNVIGLGEHPPSSLPPEVRRHLADYLLVPSLVDEQAVLRAVRQYASRVSIQRVECLWEPFMTLAGKLREALGVPGMGVAQTHLFRDKEAMKQALDAAGLRTPRHAQAVGEAQIRAAAETIGFPLVVKPIAGAGSANTHQVHDASALDHAIRDVGHQAVSVEEFIEGEEYTFDTVCRNGEILFENIAWYRPKPIIGRNEEWISMQTVNLRDIHSPQLRAGRELGHRVIDALGFRTGFTHMEWYLTPGGAAVFGEIGARPPGGRSVDLMNFTHDFDIYTGWGQAISGQPFTQQATARYNAAATFKRARGQGHICAIHGLDDLKQRFGEHLVLVDLLPIGAPRRNWKQTLLGDGYLVVRHPQLEHCLAMADAVGTDLWLEAR